MKRPVMDILYLDEVPATKSHRIQALRLVGKQLWRFMRLVGRFLAYDPLAHTALGRFRNEDGSFASRLMRGIAYRLAFVPVIIALITCALVYSGTHPKTLTNELDPASLGIYYDAVTCLTDDGVPLEGWLVPAMDARAVLNQQDKILREKHAAVVLVHDSGGRRQQMLSLVRPLHDSGFVVLVMGLRGCAQAQTVGQTFGLHETMDVKAAVDLLRRRAFVDPERISIVGLGAGANAAMLHAGKDDRLVAIVLDDPIRSFDELLDTRLVPSVDWMEWIRPLCRWTFELAYKVDADELDLRRYEKLLQKPTVLTLDGNAETETFSSPRRLEQIRHFLAVRSEEKLLKQNQTAQISKQN